MLTTAASATRPTGGVAAFVPEALTLTEEYRRLARAHRRANVDPSYRDDATPAERAAWDRRVRQFGIWCRLRDLGYRELAEALRTLHRLLWVAAGGREDTVHGNPPPPEEWAELNRDIATQRAIVRAALGPLREEVKR